MDIRDVLHTEADIRPDFITSCLHDYVENCSDKESRVDDDLVHVSGLLNFCPRKKFLLRIFRDKIDKDRAITGGHHVMWRIGRAVESLVRDAVIYSSGDRSVYGDWACKCGRSRITGFLFDAAGSGKCPLCRTELDVYEEVVLVDEEHGIMGRPDLLLFKNGNFIVVEVKSSAKSIFDSLTKPSPDYILQATFYHWLLRRNGLSVSDRLIVFYVQKEFKFGSPYKEFTVDVSKSGYDAITNLLEQAKMYKESLRDGVCSVRICDSENSSRARSCCVCDECFLNEFYKSDGKPLHSIKITRRPE